MSDFPDDISSLRVNRSELPVIKTSRRPRLGWFIKGPIPGTWISRASKLPGKSIHVALAIRYQLGLSGQPVILTTRLLDKFGVSNRKTIYQAVENLEAAGLVEVVARTRGRCVRVNVLEVGQ